MFVNTIFSGTLLSFPVLVTLGLYIGLNWQHINETIIQGKTPTGWAPNIGGGGPVDSSTPAGKFRIDTYCQKAFGIDPFPGRYTRTSSNLSRAFADINSRGDDENSGTLCMNVTVDPKVKKTEKYAPSFNVTWGFPRRTNGQPVHAFPNAKLNSTLPVQISSIATLPLDVQWTYAVGNNAATAGNVQQSELTAATLNANVAVDMFVSDNQDDATSATKATHEIMVWLARYGTDSPPVGAALAPAVTQTVGGTTFTLWYGVNGAKQQVFTWFADQVYSFTGDLAPLVQKLTSVANGPSANSYLGYYAFGSEAFSVSGGNVTFGVQKLELDVTTS